MVGRMKVKQTLEGIYSENVLFLCYKVLDSKDHGQELKSITEGGNARTRTDVVLQIICSRVANFGNQRFSVSKGKVKSKLNFKDKCKHLLHCVYLSVVTDQNKSPTFGLGFRV
jgi:hypothetical protein